MKVRKKLCLLVLGLLTLILGSFATASADGISEEKKAQIRAEYDEICSLPNSESTEVLFGKMGFDKVGDDYVFPVTYLTDYDMQTMSSKFYNLHIVNYKSYKYVGCADGTYKYDAAKKAGGDTEMYTDRYYFRSKTLNEVLEVTEPLDYNYQYNIDVNPYNAQSISEWHEKGTADNSYILVFKPDAKTIDDLLYKIPYSDLVNWMSDGKNKPLPKDDRTPAEVIVDELNVTIGDPIKNTSGWVTGHKIKLGWKLRSEKDDMFATGDYFKVLIDDKIYYETREVRNGNGSLEFDVNHMVNDTYTWEFALSDGKVQKGTFKIDDIHEVAEVTRIPVSSQAPKVTITNPNGTYYVGDKVKLKLETDIPCKVWFDNVYLTTSYITELEVEVMSNGTYSYEVVDASGKSVKGSHEVDFFKEKPVEEKTNKEVVVTQKPSSNNRLEQTGEETNNDIVLFVFIGLIVIGVIVIFARFAYARHTANKKEE